MAEQYVAASELADYRGIGDSNEDPRLRSAIESAEEKVDEWCGWGVGGFNQDTSATPRVFPTKMLSADCRVLNLPAGFVTTSGLDIKTDDNDDGVFETTWLPADYELAPIDNYFGGVDGFPYYQIRAVGDRVFPTGGRRSGRIQVTAQWGWAAVPEAVKTAVLIRAASLLDRKNSMSGRDPVTGFRAGGVDHDWTVELGKIRHPRKDRFFA